jgi:hypothetical protein
MKIRLALLLALLVPAGALAASLPPIVAGAGNEVPACVAPDTLMDFVAATNSARRARAIEPRFDNIAQLYRSIGVCVARPPEKCVAVRWDYAFFQMLIETNYLTFRRPDGAPAGVPASDIPQPVAKRTRLVQTDVQDIMRRLNRPVTFADLAREWTGTDKNTYGRDMQRLAEKYAQHYCDKQQLTAR